MPLTPERQREILAQRGLNPDEYEVVPFDKMQGAGPQSNPMGTKEEPVPPVQQPTMPPTIGAGESFRRAATESAAPTIAGVLAGGAATAEAFPPAHFFPPWTELAAGAIGAGLAGWGAHKLQKAVVPQTVQDKYFTTPESAAQNPKSTYVGNLAPSLLAFNPIKGAANLAQLGKEASLIPTVGRSAISPQSMETIMNAGPMAGISAGQNIYEQSQSKEPFSFKSLAADVAPSILLNAPTKLGRRLMFQPAEQPVSGHDAMMQELQAKREAMQPQPQAQETTTPAAIPLDNLLAAGGARPSPDVVNPASRGSKSTTLRARKDAMEGYDKTFQPDINVQGFENEGGPVRPEKTNIREEDFVLAQKELQAQQARKAELDRQEAAQLKAENDARGTANRIRITKPAIERSIDENRLAGPEAQPEQVPGTKYQPIEPTAVADDHAVLNKLGWKDTEIRKLTTQQKQKYAAEHVVPNEHVMSEAERIQDEYDRGLRHSTEPTMSPEERTATRESIKPAADEVATRRGYATEEVPKLTDEAGTPVAGSLKQSTRDIKLSTDEQTGASGGTTSHELVHGFGYDLAHSKAERDQQHITKAFQAVTGDRSLTHADVLAHYDNPVKGSRLYNAEESLAKLGEKGGYQQLKTDLYGTRREKLKQYAGEVANHIRVKFGKEVTPENMADFLHSRIRGDAPYGERPELLLAKGTAAPATQTTDDTKHSEQPKILHDNVPSFNTAALLNDGTIADLGRRGMHGHLVSEMGIDPMDIKYLGYTDEHDNLIADREVSGKFLPHRLLFKKPDSETKYSTEPEPLDTSKMKDAPVEYKAYWDALKAHIYNLKEDIGPSLVKGSTVTEKTLNRHGYKIPDSIKAKEVTPPAEGSSDVKHSIEPVPLNTNKEEQVGDPTKKGFLRSIEAAFDKVGRHDTKVRDALIDTDTHRSEHIGKYVSLPEKHMDELGSTPKERLNVLLHDRAKYKGFDDTGKAPKALTPKEQAISKIYHEEHTTPIREYQNKIGLKVEGKDGVLREAGKDPMYTSDVASDKFIHDIQHTSRPEVQKMTKNVADYWTKYGKMDPKEALKKATEYIGAIGKRSGGMTSEEFKALRTPEGIGLPSEYRDMDLISVMRKYGKRAAGDMAYFEHLQKPARIASALGLPDQAGKIPTTEGVHDISGTPEVQNAMTSLHRNYSSVHQPEITAVTHVVNNALLQTATGLRDVASVPVNSLPYMHKFADFKTYFTALGGLKDATIQSLKYGARSKTMDVDRWNYLSNPNGRVEFLNKVAEAMRKYSGRDLLEQGSRIYTFALGKDLARLNIIRAARGDKGSIEFLKKFGTLVDTKSPSKIDIEGLNRIAKNFVDRNQGTYDGRGLATGVNEGSLAPFMALSRWGIEKSNVIYKDVVNPMKEGNYKPFLLYTLGSILTGAAIKQLNQFMSGKKEQNASLSESVVASNKIEAAAAIVNLLQLGSYAGFMSDVAKMGTDVFVHHQKPSTLNFPLMSFATDTVGQGLADWSTAMEQGEDPLQASVSLAYQILKGSIQDVRLADQRFAGADETEKKNKYRDLRVFKTLYDYPTPQPDFGHDNTLLGEDTKKFKKTDNMGEAAALIPNLLGKALETSKNADGTVNIDKLKSKVAGLKGNSYQTIPSPEESPQEFVHYMGFLRETQGDDAARSRLVDYMVQRAKNQAKSSMIPSF